jgi:hypothetical protein
VPDQPLEEDLGEELEEKGKEREIQWRWRWRRRKFRG